MLTIIFLILAFIFSWIRIRKQKSFNRFDLCECLLTYLIFFNIGCNCILAAIAHLFFGSTTIEAIGWVPKSPFQIEIAVANLSFGILGITSLWRKGGFKTAVLWGWSIFTLGAFIGHAIQQIYASDGASLDFGIFVWLDEFAIPVFLIGLYLFRFRVTNQRS